ncbi:heme-binding protein, partial [Desulfovibrio oxamicus]|nr:heme-binding protein [Nitratidesulfovibrio oxamicus]
MAHETRTILNTRCIGGLLLAALLAVACGMAVAAPAQAAPAD